MVAAVLRCLGGYLVACVAAAIIEVSFVLPPHELLSAGIDRLTAAGIWLLLASLHTAIFAAPFAAIMIGIAERRGLKSSLYYVCVGIGIAALGFLAQLSGTGAVQPVKVTLYPLVAFSVAGIVGGAVYWFLSGRKADQRGWRIRAATRDVATQ
jgi:uncharacterized membrane protein